MLQSHPDFKYDVLLFKNIKYEPIPNSELKIWRGNIANAFSGNVFDHFSNIYAKDKNDLIEKLKEGWEWSSEDIGCVRSKNPTKAKVGGISSKKSATSTSPKSKSPSPIKPPQKKKGEVLKDSTIKELIAYCKKHQIKGYSNKNKDELIALIKGKKIGQPIDRYQKVMTEAGYLSATPRVATCPICKKKFQTYHKSGTPVCSERCFELELDELVKDFNIRTKG